MNRILIEFIENISEEIRKDGLIPTPEEMVERLEQDILRLESR